MTTKNVNVQSVDVVNTVKPKRVNKYTASNLQAIIERICTENNLKMDMVIADLRVNTDFLPKSFGNNKGKKTSENVCTSHTMSGTPCKKMGVVGEELCTTHLKMRDSPSQKKVKERKTSNSQCEHIVGKGDKQRQCRNKALVGQSKCHNHQ